MKKILTIAMLISGLWGASSAFAYYGSSYQGQYVIPTYSSYTYSDGCNTYRYDPYTRTSTFLYTTCQTYTYSYPSNYYGNGYSGNYAYYPCADNGYYYGYTYYNCYNYSSYVNMPYPVVDGYPYNYDMYGNSRYPRTNCNSYYYCY